MIGYTLAEQAIRAALGLPPDTGTDDEATWHDQCPRCPRCGDHRHGGPCGQQEARPAA
jgi:hypothetical protein